MVRFNGILFLERCCIFITPEWLERETPVNLAALRFIAFSLKSLRSSKSHRQKGTFRFSRVLANSLAEIDRSSQLTPDPKPVPKRRKMGPAAPAPCGNTGNPESAPGSPGAAVIVPLFLFP